MTEAAALPSLSQTDEAAIDLLMQMMAIPGRSGQEREIAEFIQDKVVSAGAKAEWFKHDSAHQGSPLGGQVGNLVLKLKGTIDSPRRLLVAHMDTVPICEGSQPVRDGRRIYAKSDETALGADDRTGSAVLLLTAARLLHEGTPHPPLTFFWTVQEEYGLAGVRHLDASLLGEPQLAFNLDGGSADKLTIGATGAERIRIKIRGIPSHAGMAPEEGVSAVAIAALAISDLQREGWHGLVEKNGRVGTSNVGVVQGGMATNVVAESVIVHAEARSHDPAFRKIIVEQILQSFENAAQEVQNVQGERGSLEVDLHHDYESFRLALDEPAVVAGRMAVEACGREVEYAIANGGLDANWITHHGFPCVTIGCGQRNIHTVDEEVDIEHFLLGRDVAWKLATGADIK